MADKEWLYFILDNDGRSYYVEANGAVSSTVIPTPLVHVPSEWQDIMVGIERDKKRFGHIRSFSFPLTFVIDGATILRTILYTMGPEYPVFLMIAKRKVVMHPTTYDDYYTRFYRGEIDLTTFQDSEDKFVVQVAEEGTSKDLKAGEAIHHEFALNHPKSVAVNCNGLNLKETMHFLITAGKLFKSNRHHIGAGFTVREGRAAGIAGHQQFLSEHINGDAGYVFDATLDIQNVRMRGKIKVHVYHRLATNATSFYQVYLQKQDNTTIDIVPAGSQMLTNSNFHTDLEIDFDITFDMNTGEQFEFIGFYPGFGAPGDEPYVEYTETNFTLEFTSRYTPTTIRGFRPADLLEMLGEKITGQPGRTLSTLFNSGPWNGVILTNGDGIRSMADAKLKINFNEFFDVYSPLAAAGVAVEKNIIRFENLEYFYDNKSDVIDLGELKDLKIHYPNELPYAFNKLTIGHKEQMTEGVNGKYGFNNAHEYAAPKKKTTHEFVVRSRAIADPYSIEYARSQLDGKDTTDDRRDNELFILNTQPMERTYLKVAFAVVLGQNTINLIGAEADIAGFSVGEKLTIAGTQFNNQAFTIQSISVNSAGDILVFVQETVVTETAPSALVIFSTLELKRVSYVSIEGIPDQSDPFNIEDISPKRIVNRWKKWINSVMYHHAGEYLSFKTTEWNDKLKTEYTGGVVVQENSDVLIEQSNIIFKPYEFTFETLVPVDLIDINENTPNRRFRATTSDGIELTGFIIRGGISPDDNKSQVFILLCDAKTDISKLII